MSDAKPIRRALISVYDKTGIVAFARALHDEFGVEIISTGGTAKTLTDAGVPVTPVESITGFPEMLDGRVKTLHPKIHAAILADRDNPEHMRQLAEAGIEPIDMVVVNLYPFEKTVADPDCTFEQAIEMIDIGGPCLLRAAGKNAKHVLVVPGATYFRRTLRYLRGETKSIGTNWLEFLQTKAFQFTATYEIAIHNYIGRRYWGTPFLPAMLLDLTLDTPTTGNELRYGENPHQKASIYSTLPQGLELGGGGDGDTSFNNYADASAALELCAELSRAVIGGALLSRVPKVGHRLSAGADEGREDIPPIEDEYFHRRNLPHIQRPDASYLLTFRLRAGSLSASERDIVAECILFPVGRKYALHGAVVMADHVHLLITPLEVRTGHWVALGEIVKGIKGVSARRINESRGRRGSVWQDEYWDTIIRSEAHLSSSLEYIHENADRAELDQREAYPWCLVEKDIGWDPHRRSAGLAMQPRFAIGRVDAQVAAEPRGWHRLIAGAPRQGSAPRPVSQRAAPRAGASAAAVCFIKHTNACGAAVDENPIEAYRQAYLGDPNAAMGGVLAVNFDVDAAFAEAVMATYQRWGKPLKAAGHPSPPGAFFLEVWVAPSFDEEAERIIRGEKEGGPQKPWGERVQLLEVGDMSREPDPDELDMRSIAGGVLMQTRDVVGLNEDQWKVVTKRGPTEGEMADLRLAWLICKHTKSNAITICRDGMLIGNGAGQMSRVMSCRIATWLAKENGHLTEGNGERGSGIGEQGSGNGGAASRVNGPVAASDAFFPFRDGPDILIDAGVTAIIQPGGSKRDDETIAACDERGVAMVFTGTRHFRH